MTPGQRHHDLEARQDEHRQHGEVHRRKGSSRQIGGDDRGRCPGGQRAGGHQPGFTHPLQLTEPPLSRVQGPARLGYSLGVLLDGAEGNKLGQTLRLLHDERA